ncbi:hypothetical protein ACFOEK_07260 [Litoribrevibacter euphylliae]|uniref:Uncharacterized protein n=1 Tax=Litoribrevibacter euphylliae TaxID=1834034 RepID=A0ABV7HEE1_9GAMM
MSSAKLQASDLVRPVFDAFHQQYIRSEAELRFLLINLSDQGAIRDFEVEIILEILTSASASTLDLKRVNSWIGPHLRIDI